MQAYQREFLAFALDQKVLCFGEFRLKSGRISPYFFNAGLFHSGATIGSMGSFYAAAIEHHGLIEQEINDAITTISNNPNPDLKGQLLFGPAYKGIPLVVATSIALNSKHGRDVPFAFNRKEAKDHGEGGSIVGASLGGKRVIIVDDVITAGTAIREAVGIIEAAGGTVAGVVVALDRQERTGADASSLSAVDEIRSTLKVPVVAIASLDDLVTFMKEENIHSEYLSKMEEYREKYRPASLTQ